MKIYSIANTSPKFLTFSDNPESSTTLQDDSNLTRIKKVVPYMSFGLACLEVIFGFLQNTTISRTFALTSLTEALGALSLNLPQSDKIMNFVQTTIGGLLLFDNLNKNNGGYPLLNKLAEKTQKQFKNFTTKYKLPHEKILFGTKLLLPLMGLTLAVLKDFIANNTNNSTDKIAFQKSALIDKTCFLESVLLFLPPSIAHVVESPYQLISGSVLLYNGLTLNSINE